MTSEGLQNWDARFQRILQRAQKGLDPSNQAHVERFARALRGGDLSLNTIDKYLYSLRKVSRWGGKDLSQCAKVDIERIVEAIQGEEGNPYTRRAHKIALKKFFKWLRGTEEHPPEVKWIKLGQKPCHKKLPDALLVQKEVQALVQAAHTPRDRALVAFLWDSGARIGEVLFLRVKHVAFEAGGARVTLPRGKTGARRVKVVASAPLLAVWLQHHPLRGDPEAPLWVRLGNSRRPNAPRFEPLSYEAVRALLLDLAKRAGVAKKVNPHNFRHSRATFLAKRLTEPVLCEYMGWAPNSDQPATYVHLSGRDTDAAIDQLYGIAPREAQEPVLKPRRCPRCQEMGPPDAPQCGKCAYPFDLGALGPGIVEALGRILKNPRNRDVIARMLVEEGCV